MVLELWDAQAPDSVLTGSELVVVYGSRCWEVTWNILEHEMLNKDIDNVPQNLDRATGPQVNRPEARANKTDISDKVPSLLTFAPELKSMQYQKTEWHSG